MKTKTRPGKGLIKRNKSTQGETIEQKVERIVNNKEPIKDGAPIIFTERKAGVNASHNIRTDRFKIAAEAADKISGSYKAKREERIKTRETKKDDGKTEPIQGKDALGGAPTDTNSK